MKPSTITLVAAVIALAGCDSDMVRLDPAHAPHANQAGLQASVEQFRKDSSSADVWLRITNQSNDPITLTAAAGGDSWATVVTGDQHATVKVLRWSNHADYDDVGAMSERDLIGSYTLAPGATREVEIYATVPHALATSHEPWSVSIAIKNHGTITLPVVDPQVASLR